MIIKSITLNNYRLYKGRQLATGTERIFSLNTMKGNGGEKDAQALICMCIARMGSIDIMKDPNEAIQVISEYANGGFYHIMKLMENGENTFNDFEKVKQEIFSRDHWNRKPKVAKVQNKEVLNENIPETENEEAILQVQQDYLEKDKPIMPKVRQRWTMAESSQLKAYYQQGMTISQLASFFGKSEENVKEQLAKLGSLE